eukprot:PITA_12272
MIHSLHSRKEVGMLMQLDLSKAYDKVSSKYLEVVLRAFGFCRTWIKWILALIKSPRYSILVNGAPSIPFTPSRGIRQGDPLSPFLFVIIMEGLSRTIAKKKAEGKIKGLQPIKSLPATTHQQFVDDTMLHGSPTVKEAVAYRDILDLFSQASGMEINFSKSTIFFFNTHPAVQSHLSQLLGFRIGSLPSRYLGAPLTLRPWQKGHSEKILANMKKRCSHWTNRALNLAAKLILTKAVLQAIPQYLLSMLPAPKGSPIWNHAKRNNNLVQENNFWEIRNGRLALFWEDAWQQLPKLDSPELTTIKQTYQTQGRYKVSHYWNQYSTDDNWRDWINLNPGNTEVNNHTNKHFNERILKRKIRKTEEDDKLRWGLKGNGNFSLKEARNILEKEEQAEVMPWCSKVWDSLLWPKIRTFLWLLMRNKTLTWENLCKKCFEGPSRCPMCSVEEESLNHLCNTCEWASQLWCWMEWIPSCSDRKRDSIHNTILDWRKDFSGIQRVNSIWKSVPGFLLWSIWKERNRRIFQDEHKNMDFSKNNIITNIQQLIQTKCREVSNEKPTAQDLRILKSFRLEGTSNIIVLQHRFQPPLQNDKWQCPPEGGLKLNFDRELRGNLGKAGIGGVLRNQHGEILHIYYKALGESTNNEMEFAALEHGLRIAKSRCLCNIILEGDSSLVISTAQKLQRGTKANKATKHWRLAKVTESIAELMEGMQGLVFQAVRRRANGLVDYLANCGVDSQERGWDNCWEEVNCPILKNRCIQLAQQDLYNTDRA